MKQEKFKLILEPNNNDVLCGRGSITYLHPGNKQFRSIVSRNKKYYNQSENGVKTIIARSIVSFIQNRSPQGRFLAQTKQKKMWSEITFDAAVQKTQQALREKSKWTKSDSKLLKETVDEESGDMRNEDLDPLYSGRFITNPKSRVLSEEEKQDLHYCELSHIFDMSRISPREDYIDELIVDIFHNSSGTDTGSNQNEKTNISNCCAAGKESEASTRIELYKNDS